MYEDNVGDIALCFPAVSYVGNVPGIFMSIFPCRGGFTSLILVALFLLYSFLSLLQDDSHGVCFTLFSGA